MEQVEQDRLSGPQTLGAAIRTAREARGLSLPQLGALLKIDNTRLRWMEEGRFGDFRQPVFVRGYLRSCARHLDLDERELLAQFDALYPNTEVMQAAAPKRRPPPPLQRGNRAIKVSAAGFVLVLLGLWLALGGGAEQLSSRALELDALPFAIKSAPSTTTNTPVTVATAVAPVASVATAPDASERPIEAVADSALPAPRSEPAAPAENDAEEQSPVVAYESVPSDRVTYSEDPEVGSDAQLVLEFTGECWVEIRNADRVLHANMQRAGDRLQLAELPPYQVLLGDARWVSVTYNGDSIPVIAAEGTNTARFTIGDEL